MAGKFRAFKRGREKILEKKTKSFGWCLVLSEKYSKSFGGKIVLRKKGLHFWTVSGFEWKIFKSFGGKILPCATDFSCQKSEDRFHFRPNSVQNRRTFFLFGNPTQSKNSKREPTFWLVSRPLLKAQFFFVDCDKVRSY